MFEVSPRRPYGVAVLAVASATLLTLALWPLIEPHITPLFFAAVMFSAWYGGLRSGLLSTILSTALITYFSSTVLHAPIVDLAAIVRLGVFVLVALTISSAYEQLHAAKQRAEVNLFKLQASEERYRCIVETAKEGIWVVDAQMRTEYVNQRLAEMFGYTVEEMLARPIFDFMDYKARILAERHIERNRQCIKEQFDFCYQRKDGSPLWAIVRTSLILNQHGEFCGAIAMLTDVTERKQAEAILKRYQLLSEHSRDIVLLVRLDGQIIEANHAAASAYGYDKAELLSLKIEDLRAPQTHALIAEQIEEADKHGILFETIHTDKDGRLFPVEVSAQSTVIGKEKVVLSIIRDITKRKAGEVALRKSEERYRAFIEHSSEGIWCFELEQPISAECSEDEQVQHFYQYGYLAECNNVMAQMYGFNCAQEIVGARLGDFLVRSEPNNIEYLRAFIRSGYRLNDAESHEIDRQGEPKYFLNNLVGIAENGFLVRAWGTQRDITERRRIEESSRHLAFQVKEQANTLNAILSASVDHIYIFDRAARYKYVSAGGAQVIGFSPSELVGKTMSDIGLPSETIERFNSQRAEVIATGQPSKYEIDFLSADGLHHYEYIIAPLRDRDESVDGVVVVSRDITKRKRAQEALQETNQTLQALIQASPLAIISMDLDGRVKMWSPAAQSIFGWTEQEVVGCPLPFVPQDKQEEFRKLHRAKIGGESIAGVELCRQKQDGQKIDVAVWGAPLYDAKGRISGTMAVIADVTERKRTEEALRISEAKFRRLAESNIVGVSISEHGGRIKEANDAFLQMTGYTREELVAGRLNWREMTPPEYLPKDDLALAEINSNGVCSSFEKENIRKDGSRVPILIGCALLEGSQDTAICFILDLSDRKRAEEEREQLLAREQEARHQAEAANRMKDEFMATLSHELRTPLNAMLGWTQLLRTRKLDEATVARALETIDRNTKSLSLLIEDVLDVSRIITGKLRLNVSPIELSGVIEAAISTVLPAAEAKGIQIESMLDPYVGKVLGDSARLQQVVWNLLSNAVKFTPKGGRVEVRLERIEEVFQVNRLQVEGSDESSSLQPFHLHPSNPYVQIRVSDTGQGISGDFLPYVFERFRQADGTTTRSHGGLGLGLAIVRHLVELQGGTVHAESPGIGQGATFIVKLPLMAVSRDANASGQIQPSVKDEAPYDQAPALDDLRVLIVDDEVDARELLSAMLVDYGAEVIAVATAREALEALHTWKPNILVSDIGMPEEDGYALIRKVRALDAEQGGRIPAVALTAYARAEDRDRAIKTGFQLHVPKPVNPAELAVVVAKLTGRTKRV